MYYSSGVSYILGMNKGSKSLVLIYTPGDMFFYVPVKILIKSLKKKAWRNFSYQQFNG